MSLEARCRRYDIVQTLFKKVDIGVLPPAVPRAILAAMSGMADVGAAVTDGRGHGTTRVLGDQHNLFWSVSSVLLPRGRRATKHHVLICESFDGCGC